MLGHHGDLLSAEGDTAKRQTLRKESGDFARSGDVQWASCEGVDHSHHIGLLPARRKGEYALHTNAAAIGTRRYFESAVGYYT